MIRRFHHACFALLTFVAGFVLAPPAHLATHAQPHSHGGTVHDHSAGTAAEAEAAQAGTSQQRSPGEPFDPSHGRGSVAHASFTAAEAIALTPLGEPSVVVFALRVPIRESGGERDRSRRAHLVRGPPVARAT
jgi:hypothetical protein